MACLHHCGAYTLCTLSGAPWYFWYLHSSYIQAENGCLYLGPYLDWHRLHCPCSLLHPGYLVLSRVLLRGIGPKPNLLLQSEGDSGTS